MSESHLVRLLALAAVLLFLAADLAGQRAGKTTRDKQRAEALEQMHQLQRSGRAVLSGLLERQRDDGSWPHGEPLDTVGNTAVVLLGAARERVDARARIAPRAGRSRL